jgi:hypothetical protein
VFDCRIQRRAKAAGSAKSCKLIGSQSLIDELTGACADVDLGRRAAILMRLTNLFISGRAAYDEQQIALFDDVLIRLSEQVEIVARRRLSNRLAAISDPPCGIIRTLAKDQNIEVALPVLPDCELDDDTLTEVATTNGQGHLQAIARRVGWIALRDRYLTDVDSLRMSASRQKRSFTLAKQNLGPERPGRLFSPTPLGITLPTAP